MHPFSGGISSYAPWLTEENEYSLESTINALFIDVCLENGEEISVKS
jgi:hypothetical protein